MPHLIGAVDQGTTSSRFMVFDRAGSEVARHQLEHRQILPQPGWVEHDPLEIAARVDEVIAGALWRSNLTGSDLAAIGITNQRETTVVWNPKTGRPWYNAIVWQDTRTEPIVRALEPQQAWLRRRTGLPPATYFSASKLQWMLEHVAGLRAAAERGDAIFGTIDTWVIWNLQLQADILGVTVVRPTVAETTALGATYFAGLAIGFWSGLEDLRQNWKADREWTPAWSIDQRERAYAGWKKAVERSLGW